MSLSSFERMGELRDHFSAFGKRSFEFVEAGQSSRDREDGFGLDGAETFGFGDRGQLSGILGLGQCRFELRAWCQHLVQSDATVIAS